MANHCYNSLVISGDSEKLDVLEKLFDKYQDFDYFYLWGNTFFENKNSSRNLPTDASDYNYYGTRWWDFTVVRENNNVLSICGDSAWSPPLLFIEMLAECYRIDCKLLFSESGSNFAGMRHYSEENELIDYEDTTYIEHIYEHMGIGQVIDEYIENAQYYESFKEFLENLDIPNISFDDKITLEAAYYEEKGLSGENEVIDVINEIKDHLYNLNMNKFAVKLEEVNAFLSRKWEKQLNTNENEQQP